MSAGQPAKKQLSKRDKIGTAITGVVLLLCCGVGVNTAIKHVFKSDPASTPSTPADRSAEAKWACEEFVKKQLKAPATAKFSGEAATKAAKPVGDEYIASGSVDSQNSFGALLRSTFSCDITYDTAKQEWTSKSVDVVPA